MKPSQIKTECELIHTQIERLNNRLTRLQSICKHETTFEGSYPYQSASVSPTTTCSDCGKVLAPKWEKLYEINTKDI